MSPIAGAPGLGGYISQEYVILEMQQEEGHNKAGSLKDSSSSSSTPAKSQQRVRKEPRSQAAAATTPVSKLAMNSSSWRGSGAQVATPVAPAAKRKRRLKEITNRLFDRLTGGGVRKEVEEVAVVVDPGGSSSSPPTAESTLPKRAKLIDKQSLNQQLQPIK